MNLVGKIFAFLILCMSLVFMALAVTVYATHTNWMNVVLVGKGGEPGLKKQLDTLKEEKAALTEEKAKLEADAAGEKAARRQQLAKLESEVEDVKRQRDDLLKREADLDKRAREAVAAMQTSQEGVGALRKEVEGLRDEIVGARKARDENFKEVVRLTDELHQSVVSFKNLNQKTTALAEQLQKAKALLVQYNVDPNEEPGAKVPKGIDGLVLATQGSDMIEISLGKDHGVRVGHQFDILRRSGGNATYLGRCEVISVEPARAVCSVDPKMRKGPIQKGDVVVSNVK
jgi:hypothetical protein